MLDPFKLKAVLHAKAGKIFHKFAANAQRAQRKLEELELNMEEAIADIMQNGLKCNYSSISRTLTHYGTNRSFSIDSILAYAYTAKNYNIRNCIIVAIPKTIKTLSGEVIDFSTPIPEPTMWRKAHRQRPPQEGPYEQRM